MLGLQGKALSSKEYRCVACSAAFTGLASLLVHQATHAGTLPKPSSISSDSNLLQTSLTHSSEDWGSSVPKVIPSTPMYTCENGEEFKQTHVSEVQFPQLLVNNESISNKDLSSTGCNLTAAQTNKAIGEDSALGPSVDENIVENENQEKPAAVTSTEDHSPVLAEAEQPLEKELAAQEMPEETEGNVMDEPEPKHKSLMKILASAYGKHLMPPQPEDVDKVVASLKEEPELVVIAPQTTKVPSTVSDMSPMQLKRFLGKPSTKTKSPSISRLLESSTKKIVSLTKIFSPVVLLETRHKFMDPSSNNMYGKYQCARCRRVFQDVDSLTEHHFLHKKERIKCCRCCKQLIIGRVPLPDNHVCPQSRAKPPYSIKSTATNGQRTNHDSMKKVYFCPICKHNFTRKYGLKKHKCSGLVSSSPPPTQSLGNSAETLITVPDEGNSSQSIGIGTRNIKIEDTSDPEYEKELSNLSWSSASSIQDQHKNASTFAASFLQEHDSQWTMPLDDGQKIHNSSEKKRRARVTFFIKNGVRRYPCNKCHQTFGLTSNLSRHRKVCGINLKGLGSGHNSNSTSVNVNNVKMYPCYVCGRNFNRKDNMMVHRKKCELRRTMIPNSAIEINSSLPPSNAPQDLPQEDDAGNWSIMSLPSVLPRRVTCVKILNTVVAFKM
ncbi:zinc finger protein 236-like isoform X2 [Boleophthalmus pectinirostris]|uniref:zinc finger protein 236-like isoform X2 n=1 Tax=Boleophthalmus pectinirostris TaxID=150288 RepID=UPI0024318001|nr:zinc finger protein 236-like isoform X2 [Boleophthalmus pectinirostris]